MDSRIHDTYHKARRLDLAQVPQRFGQDHSIGLFEDHLHGRGASVGPVSLRAPQVNHFSLQISNFVSELK